MSEVTELQRELAGMQSLLKQPPSDFNQQLCELSQQLSVSREAP